MGNETKAIFYYSAIKVQIFPSVKILWTWNFPRHVAGKISFSPVKQNVIIF